MFGLSLLTGMNLDVSAMDASERRRIYSVLSMTTTPEPLSGFVITMSSRRLRWLNRVIEDHEARASDINRKLIFSFFLLFFKSKLLKHNKQGPKFTVQQSPLISRLLVSN